MAQKNADPRKVEELIKKLGQHTNDTIEKQKRLKHFITNLESSWNDTHYKTLMLQFQEFDKKIMNALSDSENLIIPNLKNVKKAAEQYINLGKR
jgi:hypothetical protein